MLILFFVLVVGALFFVLVFLMYCGFLLVSFDVPDLVFVLKKWNGKQRTRTWKNKNNTNLPDHSRNYNPATPESSKNQKLRAENAFGDKEYTTTHR